MINWCLHRGDYLWGTNFAKSDKTSTLSTILAQREGVGVRLVSGGNRFDSSLRVFFFFLSSLWLSAVSCDCAPHNESNIMCKGFHHCLSPWWWECSIRNRQLGDQQVDRTNYTNSNTTSGRRAYHSYPEQEVYRTKDHQRLQEPEQRSAVLKKNKNKTCTVLNLASQPYRESLQELWEAWTMWVNSQLLSSRNSSRLMATTEATTLLDSWSQIEKDQAVVYTLFKNNNKHLSLEDNFCSPQ